MKPLQRQHQAKNDTAPTQPFWVTCSQCNAKYGVTAAWVFKYLNKDRGKRRCY